MTVGISLFLNSCSDNSCNCPKENTSSDIKIGVLLDLSGPNHIHGNAIKTVLEWQVDSFNKTLTDFGTQKKFQLLIEDTKSDEQTSVYKIEELTAQKINTLISGQTNSELSAIMGILNHKEILTLSVTSAAYSLAFPNDYVFRYCPNDDLHSQAISNLIYEDGIKVIYVVVRNNLYNSDLSSLITNKIIQKGGKVYGMISYSYSADVTDLTMNVTNLSDMVRNAFASYKANEVAVLFIGIEEIGDFLALAKDDNVLMSVNWYGCVNYSEMQSIISNANSIRAAEAANFTGITYGLPKNDDILTNEYTKIKQATNLSDIPIQALYAYDGLNCLFPVYMEYLNNNKNLNEALPLFSKTQCGITSWLELDDNGDRKYSIFDFLKIENSNWKIIADYQISPAYPNGLLTRY